MGPKDCEERPKLPAYARGEVPAEERSDLEAHLAECDRCRAELEGIRETRLVLELAGPSPERARDCERSSARPLSRFPGVPVAPQVLLPAAAGLVAIIVAGTALLGGAAKPPAESRPVPASRADARAPEVTAHAPIAPPVAERAAGQAAPAPHSRAALPSATPEPSELPAALAEADAAWRARRCGGPQIDRLDAFLRGDPDGRVRERALVLLARCLTQTTRRVEADAVYRQYLSEFPQGRFVAEAREAVAH